MGEFKLISSDDHIFEPPDLWTSRVESKFRDRAPRIVRLETGDDWWFTDGIKGMPVSSGAQTGLRFEGNEKLHLNEQLEHVRLGAYDPDERIKDMDLDGVYASVLYPNQGAPLFTVPDTELVNALFETYNDYTAEHCSTHPDRLKGLALINLDDVEWAVRELERSHKMRMSGALIPVYPAPGKGYHLPQYEPFWAAAQDLGMPLSLHLGTNRSGSVAEFVDVETLTPEYFCNYDYWVRLSLTQLILGGVLERFPKLIVGSVENDASWAPYFLWAMNYNYTERFQLKHWHQFKEDMLPSDYFHRNVFVTFMEDAKAIEDREIIGVDNLVWGSDYPHPESTFPRTREILNNILANCSEDEKAKIAGENAARIWHVN